MIAMNPSEAVRKPVRFHFWHLGLLLALGALLGLVLLVVGVTGYIRLGRDTRALRDSVLKSSVARWDKKVEVSVGACTLKLVRFGLSFAPLDAEARKVLGALKSVRGAEAGVYKLHDGRSLLDRAAMMAAADDVMAARGWDRMVGVLNRRDLVAIYVPKGARPARNVKVCLLALRGPDLVVASARSNLEPLWELAMEQAQWRTGEAAPVRWH